MKHKFLKIGVPVFLVLLLLAAYGVMNRRRANAPPNLAEQITRIERVIVYPSRTPGEEDRVEMISDDRA